MSAVRLHQDKNKVYDTNTVSESIYLCACGKKYMVGDGYMLKYSIYEENGQSCLYLNGHGSIPLRQMN